MRLIAFDLDDTLMWCGRDYEHSKTAFAEYIASNSQHTADEALTALSERSTQRVKANDNSIHAFPTSMVEVYEALIENPTSDGRSHVETIGYSTFKTEEEYSDRGLMAGVRPLLDQLAAAEFDLHLITAGDEELQMRKINGLGLEKWFDETHITGFNGKSDVLQELMQRHEYDPEDAFLVGNSLYSDIKAALNANAHGIYIPAHEWIPADNRKYYESHKRVQRYSSVSHLHQHVPEAFINPKTS